MEYRLLHSEELQPSLFSQFDRFQKVTDCWRKRDGVWVVEPVAFTEQWGPEEYQFLCQCLQNTLHTGGAVFGAFDEGVLKGFASVEGPALGSRGQYRDLSGTYPVSMSPGNSGARDPDGSSLPWPAAGPKNTAGKSCIFPPTLPWNPKHFTGPWAAGKRRNTTRPMWKKSPATAN